MPRCALSRRPDQQGSVLVPTLFFLAAVGILGTVLASATFTNIKVSGLEAPGPDGADVDEVGLADDSLGVALDELLVPDGTLADGATCETLGLSPYGGQRVISAQGEKVMLGCQFRGYSDGPAPNAPIFADEGQPSIRLVGGSYNSYKGLSKKDWQGDLGTPYGNPWSVALSTVYGLFASDLSPNGQLVHFGKVPLTAVGGVQARRAVTPVNTQPLGSASGSPAMQVAGPVVQGSPGLMAAVASQYPSTSPSYCGVSEPNDVYGNTSVNKAGLDVVASPLAPDAPTAQQCNVAAAASTTETSPGVTADGPVWDNATIARRKKQILDKNGNPTTDCSAYSGRKDPAPFPNSLPVMELEGAFGPAETKILNEWFRNCRATWQFVGDTYFDVNDPTQTDARKHSLVFDLYESNYVVGGYGSFAEGQPLPMSAFPNACDRTSPPAVNGEVQTRGATITLSSRTGLRHNNGRVAICGPKQTGNTYHKTAIYQKRANDLVTWKPSLQNAQLGLGTTPFTFDAGTGRYTTTSSNSGLFSRLRFDTVDGALTDGHLPLDLASLSTKVEVTGVSTNLKNTGAVPPESRLRTTFRFPRPRYRLINATVGRDVDVLECSSVWTAVSLGVKTLPLSTCLWRSLTDNSTRAVTDEVAIGEIVRYVGRCNTGPPFPFNTSTPDPNDRIDSDSIEATCRPEFNVEMSLERLNGNTAPITAIIGNIELSASTTTGFTTPLGPLSVRWAPRNLNADGTNRPGDATFNVYGSVVVPYNAVEVRFGPNGRALGTPIFNGGVVPSQNCNYSNTGQCRPALVAGALATWTTQGDPNEAKCPTCGSEDFIRDDFFPNWPEDAQGKALVPDVLARNADGRKPKRNYFLTACVIDDDRGTPETSDDIMFPRAFVNVSTVDTQTGLSVLGSAPQVTRSGVINEDDLYLQVGTCTRPADYAQ